MSGADAVRRWYSLVAPAYDLLARSRLVAPYRAVAADAAGLSAGDVVVDVGTGTGANLAHLRRRVGASGTVLGLDLTPRLLAVAAREGAGDLLLGDARDPPVCGGADALVGTFVAGMVADPETMVDRWGDCLRPGGRIVLLDAAPRNGRGTILDELARAAFSAEATPGTRSRTGRPPATVLFERIGAAHDAVAALDGGRTVAYLGGYLRVTSGSVGR
ncbi:MAG: class I SAM-dependent methyltransferase [Halanaeroarchaeum sp.]